MDLRTTSEDLIITSNPPAGQLQLGYPLSGAYAYLFCQKDSAGVITPVGSGGAGATETFYATLMQTAFPTTFFATALSKVYMNGARITSGFTIVAGVVTFNVGLELGTEVIIQRL